MTRSLRGSNFWNACGTISSSGILQTPEARDTPAGTICAICSSLCGGGDVVVTFNWDTLVERTLMEAGRWNPMTGYGFRRRLCVGISRPEKGERRRYVTSPPSEITVLKLHGSIGSYLNRGALYFNRPMYLQSFTSPGEPPLVDPEQPRTGSGPAEGAVLAYPSYLKRLKTPEIQAVWYQASRALQSASSVECWGYTACPKATLQPGRSYFPSSSGSRIAPSAFRSMSVVTMMRRRGGTASSDLARGATLAASEKR